MYMNMVLTCIISHVRFHDISPTCLNINSYCCEQISGKTRFYLALKIVFLAEMYCLKIYDQQSVINTRMDH